MAIPKQLQPWLTHVKKVRAKHPDMAYKDVLVLAKKSYKSKLSPSKKAAKKRLSEGKRMKAHACRSPNVKIGEKCYKPCADSKKGTPRVRSPKSARCVDIKRFLKTHSPATQKMVGKAYAKRIRELF